MLEDKRPEPAMRNALGADKVGNGAGWILVHLPRFFPDQIKGVFGMIFAARKPNRELDALIAKVRNAPPMTDAEIRAQRESFVRAEMAFGSDQDEAEYATALRRGDAAAVAKCEAAARARVKAFESSTKEAQG